MSPSVPQGVQGLSSRTKANPSRKRQVNTLIPIANLPLPHQPPQQKLLSASQPFTVRHYSLDHGVGEQSNWPIFTGHTSARDLSPPHPGQTIFVHILKQDLSRHHSNPFPPKKKSTLFHKTEKSNHELGTTATTSREVDFPKRSPRIGAWACSTIPQKTLHLPDNRHLGPFLASFSELWQILQLYSAHQEVKIVRLHKKHSLHPKTHPSQ